MLNSASLLTIDESENSPISYSRTQIDNKFEYMPGIDELQEYFDHDGIDIIFKYNTERCIKIVLIDNTEITLNQYKPGMKAVFLKLYNREMQMSENEILILCNDYHLKSERLIDWQNNDKPPYIDTGKYIETFDAATKDYSGYDNTRILLEKSTEDNQCKPAVYCNKQRVILKGKRYQGYLPASGQIYFLSQHEKLADEIMSYINPGCDKLNLDPAGSKNFSTIFNGIRTSTDAIALYNAWVLQPNNNFTFSHKGHSHWVIPFFKYIPA